MISPIDAPNTHSFPLFTGKHPGIPAALIVIGALGVALAACGGIGMTGALPRIASLSMLGVGSGVTLLSIVLGILGGRAKVERLTHLTVHGTCKNGGQDHVELHQNSGFAYVVEGVREDLKRKSFDAFLAHYSDPLQKLTTYKELSTHFAKRVDALDRQGCAMSLAHVVRLSNNSLRLLTAQTKDTTLFVQIDDQVTELPNNGDFRPQHFAISGAKQQVRVFGCTRGAGIAMHNIHTVKDLENPTRHLAQGKTGDFALFMLKIV